MYLRGRLEIIFFWLFDPEMADFVMVQTLRWKMKKRTGKCDKETVVNWFKTNMPHLWENIITRQGVKIEDEYFL